MTPEAQRIAIAEACGWSMAANNTWVNPHGFRFHAHHIPDYLNDLNAMHEAVLLLQNYNGSAYVIYQEYLHKIAGVFWTDATASQRAEAFLRTLGKWEGK